MMGSFNYGKKQVLENRESKKDVFRIKRILNVFLVMVFVGTFVMTPVISEAATPKTTKIKMSKTSVSVYKGQKYKLTATKANKKVKHKSIKWTTSNKKVVTVTQKGYIKGVKKGTAYVYCKVKWRNNKTTTAKCKVKVYNPVKLKSYKLSKTTLNLKVGQKATIKKVIKPSNATIIKTAISTSNKKVAIINSKGVVTAKGAGTAKLCVAIKTYNGKVYKRYCTVKVYKTATAKPTVKPTVAPTNKPIPTVTPTIAPVKTGTITVKYVDKDTNKAILQDEVNKNLKLGVHTYEAKNIDGYKLIGETSKSVTLTEDKVEAEVVFEYEKIDMDKVPYIATVYTNPDLDIDEDVILKFYATDYYHSAYLTENYEEEFDVVMNLNGTVTSMKRKVGESSINLGKKEAGEYWYTIQVIDKCGRKSAELFGEFRVEDKEKKEELIKANTHYITDSELEEYGISKDNSSENAHNTKVGLQNLINDMAQKGVRKCVLPLGIYRIDAEYNEVTGIQTVKNVIKIPSNFILDLNGSTLKQDTTPLEQDKAYMISIDAAYDAHVTNGIIEGDYGERDLTYKENGYPCAEQVGCGILAGDSKYSSFNNLVVKKFPGYAMSVGLGLASPHAKIGGGLTNWTAVEVDEKGNEVEANNKYTCDYIDLKFAKDLHTLRTGKYLGYQFTLDGDEWVVKYHFYDENKKYIKTTVGHQYRPFVKPENASYMRATYISSSVDKLASLSVYHMFTPVNSAIKDISFEDTRTCALNPNQGNNILIENCTFTRTATNITPVAIDFEDGWNLMQDYCLRNNEVLVPVGTGDIVVVGGMNLQFEQNKNFRFGTRSCTPGIVFRNNVDCSGGVNLTDIVNTGYYRYYNNKNVKYIGGTEGKIDYKVYDCTFKEVAASGNQYTEYVRCEFDWNNRALEFNTGGIIKGYFRDCILKNYTDPNNVFIHAENAYFTNCKIENMTTNINGTISFKNCDVNGFKTYNYTKDINLIINNSTVKDFTLDFNAWAKPSYSIKIKDSILENTVRKNILGDSFASYCDTKSFVVESNNNKYLNNTVIANTKVLNNSHITFKNDSN